MKKTISLILCMVLSSSLFTAAVSAQTAKRYSPAAVELARINDQIDGLQRELQYAKRAKTAAEISIPLTIAVSLSGYFYSIGKMTAFNEVGAANSAEAGAARRLTIKWFAGGFGVLTAEVLTANLTVPEILKLEVALIKLKLQNLDAIHALESLN